MRDTTVIYLAVVAGLMLGWLVESIRDRRRRK